MITNKDFYRIIRDGSPEFLKKVFSKFFRNKVLRNKIFLDTYRMLTELPQMDEEATNQKQFAILKNILIHSFENVEYYNDLFKEHNFDPYNFSDFCELEKLPFLSKEIIRKNFDRLTSKKKAKNGFYIARTGGTTSYPLKLLIDYDTFFKDLAYIYYLKNKLGYNFNSRTVTFRGVEFGRKLWRYNPSQNEYIISPFQLSNYTIKSYINFLNRYRPDYLNGYPSAILFFTRLIKENNFKLDFKVKGIFLISENIENNDRIFLENFYQAKTLSFYGHTEKALFANEVDMNIYKFEPLYGYTEFCEGEKGIEIVTTGLHNFTMPLIRYRTGDICSFLPGSDEKKVKIKGRWNMNEMLYGQKGENITHASINFHSDIFENVIDYQIIQKEIGKAELLVVANKNFSSNDINQIKKSLSRKLKDSIEINIKVVDNLILTERGKFRRIVNYLN